MRTNWIIAAGVLTLLSACTRTEDGDVVVKRPSDVSVETTKDTVHLPSLSTKTDTVDTPVIGTKTETLIVKKPVFGTKKTEVKVPVIKRP